MIRPCALFAKEVNDERESLNSRKPIYLMLAVGLTVVTTLAVLPYSLTLQKLKQQVVSTFTSKAQPEQAATNPPPAKPAFDVAAWYMGRDEKPEEHGVLIESFDGQRVFAAHNADVVYNPASLIKLATSALALKTLGADFRFQTSVYIDGKVDDKGALQGKLFVSGHDPTFGDYGANLIAEELRARGIKSINGQLVVSPDFIFNFSDKAEESGERLSKGLKVSKPPSVSVGGETSGELFLTLNSNPLRDVLLYMNAHSSNFVAEKIGALIGGASAVEQYLTGQLRLPAAQVTIATVTGREHNRMTARGVLIVIRALIEEGKRHGLEATDLLPVVGDDAGTLRRRFVGTSLDRAVVGKTGTLTAEVDGGMASLAGIVYTTDGPVVFVILDQGNRISENRQLEEELLIEVINGQATPQAIAGPTPRRLLPSANIQKQ
jgi:D-alanyl-D-alanine carboxypeptidase/D-alanyl-D-alanine-endopeptidase (penicillin-binding protein 4)